MIQIGQTCSCQAIFALYLKIMKKVLLALPLCMSIVGLHAQDTYLQVYDIISAKCGSCHIEAHESGLTLNGSAAEVYDAIYDAIPVNAEAAGKGMKVISPGDPYKSFLFSKVNNGLALDVNLTAGEGAACPQEGEPVLDNKQIELIRQWIIFGAKETGNMVDTTIIATFYDEGGIQSVPDPPAPPAPEEGFQIHYGPWFLWPETEHEYWSKFATQIPEDLEVNRIDVIMGDYSHHFIIYKYDAPTYLMNPYGLRDNDPEFLGVSLVTANQFSYDLHLPPNTAFPWESDTWLDLNSHYINYSSTMPLACEVYMNVYTQPAGTAVQEMHTELPANTDIYIPNNGLEYTFEESLYDSGDDEIFLWGISSHTHKYGTDYNVYKRKADGTKGEQIFDASCESTDGIPGCIDEIYDYQHPPIRYWDSFLPIKVSEGVIHEASYINDGPSPVWFGLTSDDEMMVLIYFYLEDTAGLNLPSSVPEQEPLIGIQSFPNPADEQVLVRSEEVFGRDLMLQLTDISGQVVLTQQVYAGDRLAVIDRKQWASGLYLLQLTDNGTVVYSEKIFFR